MNRRAKLTALDIAFETCPKADFIKFHTFLSIALANRILFIKVMVGLSRKFYKAALVIFGK